MRSALAWLALVLTIGGATAFFGWVAVPIVAGLWGLLRATDTRPVTDAVTAAAAAWLLLLAWTATQGPVGEGATRIAGIFGIPAAAFVIIVLLFPALLAGSAAGVTAALRDLVAGR